MVIPISAHLQPRHEQMDDSAPQRSLPPSTLTTIKNEMSQSTSASIGIPKNSTTVHRDSPGVCVLANAPTGRRVYPFYDFRRMIVGLVAWCLLWEKSVFDCAVQFAVRYGNQEFLRAAGGILDTGLPKTFISCDFVKKHLEPLGLHVELFSNGAETIFRTIDGNDIKSTGTLHMRFRVVGDTKFIKASFHVSEHPIEGCDILIGADIISEHWRLVRVGAPGFEPPPKPVPEHERDKALQAKLETSITDCDLKRAIREKQLQNGTALVSSRPASC